MCDHNHFAGVECFYFLNIAKLIRNDAYSGLLTARVLHKTQIDAVVKCSNPI